MAKDRDLGTVCPTGPGQPGSGAFDNGRRWEAYRDENEGRETATISENEGDGPLAIVRRNPLTAVLTGFGLGLGFGLAVALLVTRREPSWYERNISEPFHDLPDTLRRVPESIGSYIPQSWKRR